MPASTEATTAENSGVGGTVPSALTLVLQQVIELDAEEAAKGLTFTRLAAKLSSLKPSHTFELKE